jgi:flagellar hook-associated protein 2
VQTDLVALIDSMNGAFQDIAAKSAYNQETGEFGPLGSSTSLKSLRGELLNLLSTRVTTGGTITSLFDLGFAINRDGTISLDEAKLSAALAANLEDVTKLFVGDPESGITGLADLLNNKLRDVTKPTGFIDAEKQVSEGELHRLRNNIEATTTRLDQRFEILARQFAALDSFASQMQSQADFLQDMVASFKQDS